MFQGFKVLGDFSMISNKNTCLEYALAFTD